MKKLILVRHAKSSWKNPALSDFNRPLNKRGKRDAPYMGKKLREKGIKPELIIASPAVRAKKTAFTIAEEIEYPRNKIIFDDSIYEASPSELLEMIRHCNHQFNSIMIIGHNPGLTMLNNHLTNHYIDNIPACGVVGIKFNSSWENVDLRTGKFLFFLYPKMNHK